MIKTSNISDDTCMENNPNPNSNKILHQLTDATTDGKLAKKSKIDDNIFMERKSKKDQSITEQHQLTDESRKEENIDDSKVVYITRDNINQLTDFVDNEEKDNQSWDSDVMDEYSISKIEKETNDKQMIGMIEYPTDYFEGMVITVEDYKRTTEYENLPRDKKKMHHLWTMIDLENHFDGNFRNYQSYDKNQLRRQRLITAIDRTYAKLLVYGEGCK